MAWLQVYTAEEGEKEKDGSDGRRRTAGQNRWQKAAKRQTRYKNQGIKVPRYSAGRQAMLAYTGAARHVAIKNQWCCTPYGGNISV